MAKLPSDAFDYYLGLGPSRSYTAVGTRYACTKRAVTKAAVRDGWQARLAKIESTARERSDSKAVETIEAMNTRHLKILQIIQGKALDALRTFSLQDAMAAVRALDLSVKQERVIRGEPGERSAVSMEQLVRAEYERWMTPVSEDGQNQHDTNGAGE